MNYYAPTPTDIYLSPPKHLQFISGQYKSYRNIFFTGTAMQNFHGRTLLGFLMDYWTVSNVMVKLVQQAKAKCSIWYAITWMSIYIY